MPAQGAASSKGPVTLDGLDKTINFRALRAHESLSSPFRFELEVLTTDTSIDPTKVLGQPIGVHLEITGDEPRHFHGFASEFASAGSVGSYYLYRITLRPWFWFLGKRSDCRIFQNKTITAIVKEVFREAGFSDFEESLSETYKPKDYVVQYRESDLNFVSRLLEQEGIYYFFKHEAAKHVLVLADSQTAHSAAASYSEIPFYPPDSNRGSVAETIHRWDVFSDLESSAVALTDFNFEVPTMNLLTKRKVGTDHSFGDLEVYDYPGKYVASGDGEGYSKVRLEEILATSDRREADTNARGLAVGALFDLSMHPADAQNKEYLIVSARTHVRTHDLETVLPGSKKVEEEVFRSTFVAIESTKPFRPPRLARKPFVQGVQTAMVVGPSGDEIYTDEFGRVKVKFPWDRADGADEKSSCWLRVAQLWAGSGFGGIHVPRIGQEVIVDFLEGDPDRPIVTGRVYNGENAVPYALPANATQSGILSRSSKGGSAANANQFRFEDKKGSEQVFLHAEKDQDIEVEHDESHWVGHDRRKTIDHDETVLVKGNRTETVNKDEVIQIGANRTEIVASAESISIGSTRTTTVAAADSHTVGGAHLVAVGAAQSISVGGVRSLSVGAADSVTVGGVRSVDVKGNAKLNVGGGHNVDVGKDQTVTIGGARAYNVGKNDALDVGKKLQITVADEIVIKCGDASISMKKNGDIEIKGKNLTFEGSGKVNVKASSDVILKGSKIAQN